MIPSLCKQYRSLLYTFFAFHYRVLFYHELFKTASIFLRLLIPASLIDAVKLRAQQ